MNVLAKVLSSNTSVVFEKRGGSTSEWTPLLEPPAPFGATISRSGMYEYMSWPRGQIKELITS